MLARWKQRFLKSNDDETESMNGSKKGSIKSTQESNSNNTGQSQTSVPPPAAAAAAAAATAAPMKAQKGTTTTKKPATTQQQKVRVKKDELLTEYQLDKLNLHRVYNKQEEFVPIGESVYRSNIEYKKSLLVQFGKILNEQHIDYKALKNLSWKGVPAVYRAVVWRVMLDYQSTNREITESKLTQMRQEYVGFVERYFENETVISNFTKNEVNMKKVVEFDVIRTQPNYPLFKAPVIQEMLKRILLIWGLRHPASGYVQGMNDIVTPFIIVFLGYHVRLDADNNYPIPAELDSMSEEVLQQVEADSYWCLTKTLDKIQDNFTNRQPGIKISLGKIGQIIASTDKELSTHLKKEGVEFIQFAFRWIMCLLVREFPLQQVFRILDTYLADDKGLAVLHVYMCAAIILKFAKKIKKMKFHDIILFFQNLPTQNWRDEDIEMLLAEAFVYMSLYEQAHGHIKKVILA